MNEKVGTKAIIGWISNIDEMRYLSSRMSKQSCNRINLETN